MGKLFRKLYFTVAMFVLIIGAYFVGVQVADPQGPANETQVVVQWPKWTMVSSTPWIDGVPLRLEQEVGDTHAKLRFISDDYRSLVLVLDDEFWLWNFGSEPIRVGAIEDVRAAVGRIQQQENP